MNKIEIVNNELKLINIDKTISYEFSNDITKKLKIEILEDTNLCLYYDFKSDVKLDVIIILHDLVDLKLYEVKSGISSKIRTTYILNKKSNLKVFKFNDVNNIAENIVINLDGEYSKADFVLKTIATDKEKYDLMVYHNNKNTASYVKNNGAAINKGNIIFNVSSFVYAGNKGCNINQINRIVNLTSNNCKISPNLYVDEYDVSANHSAIIGKFSDSEMFYLQSRGINKNDALILLMKGFLLSDLDFEDIKNLINEKIENYWR